LGASNLRRVDAPGRIGSCGGTLACVDSVTLEQGTPCLLRAGRLRHSAGLPEDRFEKDSEVPGVEDRRAQGQGQGDLTVEGAPSCRSRGTAARSQERYRGARGRDPSRGAPGTWKHAAIEEEESVG